MKSSLLCVLLSCFLSLTAFGQQKLYKWTSAEGQTVDAGFVKLDGDTLTIDMNGKAFFFPLATLSPQSQALAKILATPEGSPLPVKDGIYDWTDTNGKTIKAKFVRQLGPTLTIEMNGKEYPVPMSRFSPASQELAKILATRAASAPSKPKTARKTPLRKDRPHQWISADGRAIEALYVKLADGNLTIQVTSEANKGQEFTLPLSSLSVESQEMARELSEIKTPQELALEKKIAAAEEAGPPDQVEIGLAIEEGQKFFRELALKDEEFWPHAPHRRRKVVGKKDVTVKYRRATIQEPIYEYKDVEKEVYRMVKEGGSEAIAVRKKVKVKVRVRGKQIGTKPVERHVRDNNGDVERVEKRNVYGPGGPDFWNRNKWGHNALAIYTMLESGMETTKEQNLILLDKFTDLYKTYGYPDMTWDLAWSVCALASSSIEEHRSLAKELAAKLAGAQIRTGECSGLWGPVCLDLELLGILSSANVDESNEYQKWQEKFQESQREKDEDKALLALDNVRKMNVLRDEYSMLLKTNPEIYYHYHNLEDPGKVQPTITVMGLPHYVFNQTSVDLGNTLLALYALNVAGKKGVLPTGTMTLAFPGNVRKFGRSLPISTVLQNAATALAKHQMQTGDFHQMNFHQVVNNFNNGLVVKGLPPSKEKFPALESPSSIAETAQGLAALDLAGASMAIRFANNRRAANTRLQSQLTDALYKGDPKVVQHPTFGIYDLALALSAPSPSRDDRKDLLGTLARYLVDSQASNGSWSVKGRAKLPMATSSRARAKTLEQLLKRETFNYALPHTPHKGYWTGQYYAHSPHLIGTAYAMLALLHAQQFAPEPPAATEEATPDDSSTSVTPAAPAAAEE